MPSRTESGPEACLDELRATRLNMTDPTAVSRKPFRLSSFPEVAWKPSHAVPEVQSHAQVN